MARTLVGILGKTGDRPTLSGLPDPSVLQVDYDCPHCGRRQVIYKLSMELATLTIGVSQCQSCGDISVGAVIYKSGGGLDRIPTFMGLLYPDAVNRPAVEFAHCPQEIETAYREACALFGVHAGAAGAYARRALELILDHAGYTTNVLAKAIDAARAETDVDRRLPKRLLARLIQADAGVGRLGVY